MAGAELETYLTEVILTIQHEMQMALDYIETVAAEEPSQLGAAPSLVTLDNMRIRIPLIFQPEVETGPLSEHPTEFYPHVSLSPEAIWRLKEQLRSRQGLLLDVKEDNLGRFAKIRVISPVSLVQAAPPQSGAAVPATPLVGEIEITMTRMPREFEGFKAGSTTAPGVGNGSPVPKVVGMTLDQATKVLDSQGWQFQARAVGAEELTTVPESYRGRVALQQPDAGLTVDRSTTSVNLWLALSNLPVDEIDGIGSERSARLASVAITTVGQLSLATAAEVAAALGISEPQAQALIDMAVFMSRLTVAGLRDEVVEVLVKGAGIHSLEELAVTDGDRLYNTCLEAVRAKRVQVPKDFLFTPEDVANWVQAAQRHLASY